MLRSAGSWSIGCEASLKEDSICNAYLFLISNAEYFIYIENQFFVSEAKGNPIQNQIANALFERIKRAFV
jgi:phospholipase D1/2